MLSVRASGYNRLLKEKEGIDERKKRECKLNGPNRFIAKPERDLSVLASRTKEKKGL